MGALVTLAVLALLVAPATAQTQITDATVDQRLAQAEAAFQQGRQDEAARLIAEVTAWANHIRDIRGGSRDPAGEAAFAERIYQRALQTLGRTFGADHLTAGDPLMGLAALYAEQQRYGEAESLFRRALAIVQQASLPAETKRYGEGKVTRELAGLYEKQRRVGDAETAYRRAADLFEQAGPRAIEARDEALVRCARMLRANGRPAEAATLEGRIEPQHRTAAARKGVEEAWQAAGDAMRAGRIADADRILLGAVREAEASGDRDLARRTQLMLIYYYRQTGRTAEVTAVCRRLGIVGPPC